MLAAITPTRERIARRGEPAAQDAAASVAARRQVEAMRTCMPSAARTVSSLTARSVGRRLPRGALRSDGPCRRSEALSPTPVGHCGSLVASRFRTRSSASASCSGDPPAKVVQCHPIASAIEPEPGQMTGIPRPAASRTAIGVCASPTAECTSTSIVSSANGLARAPTNETAPGASVSASRCIRRAYSASDGGPMIERATGGSPAASANAAKPRIAVSTSF